MRTEIKKLHQRVGKTTVYVTHDQIEAMTLASRIAVMHQGAIQQFDEPQAVYERPANMFVAGFMGSPSMNFIPCELTKLDNAPAVAIALAERKTATLPLAQTPAARPADGKVTLGVRPEHLFRYSENLKAQKPALADRACRGRRAHRGRDPCRAEGRRARDRRPFRSGQCAAPRRIAADGNRHVACVPVRSSDAIPHSAGHRLTFATYPSLAGRAVFISGGATGIGADIVRAFARNHARVAFCDLQADAGERLAQELAGTGEKALFLQCDVIDIPALQAAIRRAREAFGLIAALVNNAASDERHAIDNVSVAYWDHAQNVNLRHHFFAAQAVSPQMRELGFGSIVKSLLDRVARGHRGNACIFRGEGWRGGSDARAGARLRGGQHPRKRDRAGRGHDQSSAPALVQDAGVDRGDRAAPIDQGDAARRRGGARSAVSRRRRQPHDH
jgi:NAD(P)-dependent dehydrogenase (short-subunit alcohol dehydrogenase family)